MQTPTTIHDHPVHPMLVALPIGFLAFSIIADITFHVRHDLFWALVAFHTLGAGIVAALVAALPGFIDFLSLTGDTRRVALFHMAANLTAVVLFAISFVLRLRGAMTLLPPFVLSLVAFAIMGLGGYLGGTLVYRHRVAVREAL